MSRFSGLIEVRITLNATFYLLKGISVHSLATISLTLLDRIYEAFKQRDEAFSVDLIRVIIEELDKLPPKP